jgi:hypothetical protein
MKKTKEISPVEDKRIAGSETKPVVRIVTTVPSPEKEIGYILWGLEEEEIPAEIEEVEENSLEILAKQAADGSKLNVGIGISGTNQMAVLHHRDLPVDKPLFSMAADKFDMTQLRMLGTNAARLVKGNPLLFHSEQAYSAGPKDTMQLQQNALNDLAQLSQNQLGELITLIVTELVTNIERQG